VIAKKELIGHPAIDVRQLGTDDFRLLLGGPKCSLKAFPESL
jgi:hypothetical protein